MATRAERNATRAPRSGPRRVALWAPSVLVVALLGTSVAADQGNWGPEFLGWKGGDPASNPAAVDAPGVLGLGEVPAVLAVAAPAPSGAPDAEAVRLALAPALKEKSLGKHVVAAVAGLDGVPVFTSGTDPFVPASTTKVLTAVAALEVLGPEARFSTVVEQGSRPSDLVLVGGGDPYLMAAPAPAGSFPERADLTTLAQQTVEALSETGTTKVTLRYDTSLFEGPADNPEWERSYVPDQVVSPITALWVDSGKDPSGWGRVKDPAKVAAQAFADALTQAGITVRTPQPGPLDGVTTPIASVDSAPVSQIVERVLDVSDNEGAEVLARHVGVKVQDEGSFEAGTASVLSTLADLGVDVTGDVVNDGSGLSRGNKVKASTLLGTLALAASDDHPRLRSGLDGLPTAGFTGSLTRRFDSGADDGLGFVRAKTGTLTGVHVLAGVTTDADGVPMLFVVAADKVDPPETLEARAALDRVAAALAGCSCS